MRWMIFLLPLLVGCGKEYTSISYGEHLHFSDAIRPGEFSLRVSPRFIRPDDVVPKIYLKVDDREPINLLDITPEIVATYSLGPPKTDTWGTPDNQNPQADSEPPGKSMTFSNVSAEFQFLDDKLDQVVLGNPFNFSGEPSRKPDFKIGRSKEGPFFSVPLSREQVIELMGTPDAEETIKERPQTGWAH